MATSIQTKYTSDMMRPEIVMPDFDSVQMPEYAGVDLADLLPQLGDAAGDLSRDAVQGALDFANKQAADNIEALVKAYDRATAQTAESYKTLTDAALSQTMSLMDSINPAWRSALDASAGLADSTSKSITMYMAATLPTMMRQGANLAKAQGDLASDLLAGKVPDDVSRMVSTRAAETAGQFGIFGDDAGGAGRAMEARDLGLTSLQLQGQGAQMAKENAGLWSAAATEAAHMAASAQAPIDTYLKQQEALLPNVDINSMFKDAQDMYVKSSVVSPDTVFSAALTSYNNAMGWGLDVYKTNLDAQSSYDSMALQFETDKMNAKVAAYNAQLAADTAMYNAALNARAAENAATIQANALMKNAQTAADASITSSALSSGRSPTTGQKLAYTGTWDNPTGARARSVKPLNLSTRSSTRSWHGLFPPHY